MVTHALASRFSYFNSRLTPLTPMGSPVFRFRSRWRGLVRNAHRGLQDRPGSENLRDPPAGQPQAASGAPRATIVQYLVVGPDKNLWGAYHQGNVIWSMSLSGKFNMFPVLTPKARGTSQKGRQTTALS
jgi:hypothetical protein